MSNFSITFSKKGRRSSSACNSYCQDSLHQCPMPINTDQCQLSTLAPFVREHSLLSTVHNILKMEVEQFQNLRTMCLASSTREIILNSQCWKYWQRESLMYFKCLECIIPLSHIRESQKPIHCDTLTIAGEPMCGPWQFGWLYA